MTSASSVDGGGKHRPEQGRTGWALSRGPGVVFRMAAGDPKRSICFLLELSGESRVIVTASRTETWSDRRANEVTGGGGGGGALMKRECSCSLGAPGFVLVGLSHAVQESNLSHPRDC